MIAILLALSVASQPAPQQAAEAKTAFSQAQGRFEVGDFQGALDGFTKAYELSKHPEILFNIGQCHRNLGDLRRSIFFFERYLDTSNKKHPEIRRAIEEMKLELQNETKTSSAAPPVVTPPPPAPPPLTQQPEAKPTSVGPNWLMWGLVTGGIVVLGATLVAIAGLTGPDDDVITIDYRDL